MHIIRGVCCAPPANPNSATAPTTATYAGDTCNVFCVYALLRGDSSRAWKVSTADSGSYVSGVWGILRCSRSFTSRAKNLMDLLYSGACWFAGVCALVHLRWCACVPAPDAQCHGQVHCAFSCPWRARLVLAVYAQASGGRMSQTRVCRTRLGAGGTYGQTVLEKWTALL